MSQACVATATMMCSFGAAPSVLSVTSDPTVLVESKPLATIMDFAPMANIPPFGVCSSLANPTVASATVELGRKCARKNTILTVNSSRTRRNRSPVKRQRGWLAF